MLFVDIEVAVLAFVALWSHSPYDSLTVVAVSHLKIKIVSIHNKEYNMIYLVVVVELKMMSLNDDIIA